MKRPATHEGSGPLLVTGHRFGDFAHTHRTFSQTPRQAALRCIRKGDDGAGGVTMREV